MLDFICLYFCLIVGFLDRGKIFFFFRVGWKMFVVKLVFFFDMDGY